MAITSIEMTGGKNVDLFAHITKEENVLLGLKDNKLRYGTVLKHDQFVNSEQIKLSESCLAKIKEFGLEEQLQKIIIYLKKFMVK